MPKRVLHQGTILVEVESCLKGEMGAVLNRLRESRVGRSFDDKKERKR